MNIATKVKNGTATKKEAKAYLDNKKLTDYFYDVELDKKEEIKETLYHVETYRFKYMVQTETLLPCRNTEDGKDLVEVVRTLFVDLKNALEFARYAEGSKINLYKILLMETPDILKTYNIEEELKKYDAYKEASNEFIEDFNFIEELINDIC